MDCFPNFSFDIFVICYSSTILDIFIFYYMPVLCVNEKLTKDMAHLISFQKNKQIYYCFIASSLSRKRWPSSLGLSSFEVHFQFVLPLRLWHFQVRDVKYTSWVFPRTSALCYSLISSIYLISLWGCQKFAQFLIN